MGFIKGIMIAVGLVLIAISVSTLLLTARPEIIESTVMGGLEDSLSHVFGSRVNLEGLRFNPLRGECRLEGLSLENPPQFKAGEALLCEEALVKLNYRSLFSKNPTIENITLDGTRAELRYGPGKGTNLGTLAKQAAALSEAMPESDSGRQWIVREVNINGAKVKVGDVPLPLTVAPFKIKEVDGKTPLTITKLSAVTLKSLLLETLTVKGLLSPVVNLLRGEVS